MSSQRSQNVKMSTTSNQVVKVGKEPKFVPYEPYKAAVNPIIPVAKKNSKKCKNKKGNNSLVTLDKVIYSLPSNVAVVSPLASNSSDELRDEVLQLQKEKKELEEQLNMQIKVNHDLKKLLVASVGEDLEARVQFLTQDKVKLAHDVHCYVQRLLDDHEELEKLSIQCDVWRSKFLASSLIVDELANWKAVLFHRFDEALTTLQLLMEEQTKLDVHLRKSYCCLKAIEKSKDPRSKKGNYTPSSTLQLADQIEKLSLSLHKRELGTNFNFHDSNTTMTLTPVQERARKVLNGPGLNYVPSNNLSLIGDTNTRNSIIHRFHPNTRFEHLTMNCCKHCSGEIKLL